jgi:beta-glucosidase
MKRSQFIQTLCAVATALPREAQTSPLPFRDPSLPVAVRVDDLIARLSLEEKVAQMNNKAPAIERLGIHAYDWWSEALHGIAREGYATVFPQSIGMAATWNTELIADMGRVVATEARAKYNATGVGADHGNYNGLTVWSPNINIFRDPRWGRGQETFGEDPFLTSQIGVAYVRGLQGDDPRYLSVAACAKHFAVHSGPERLRHVFNVNVDSKTLHEFYLYAFRALVRDAGVAGVMSAYNALDGVPCSENPELLRAILRDGWKFDGYVTSDCGAVWDMVEERHLYADFAHAAAKALAAGVDLCCGDDYLSLAEAVQEKIVTETQIDRALRYLFTIRFRLGMFDPAQMVRYDAISPWDNDTAAHQTLAQRVARESLVLLKNEDALPLRKSLMKVAVIGPNADSIDVLLGDYEGTPSRPVTVFRGIRAKLPSHVDVQSLQGCAYVVPGNDAEEQRAQAITLARQADAVIFVGGISPQLEGEEKESETVEGFDAGDRTKIELPAIQTSLLKALHATGKPVILVLMSGGAIACPWEAANLPAILQVWYPGEEGGTAIADVLFGDYNPAGRLPITVYASTADLPPFEDYALTNRTYRYFTGKPLFAFGHGLSYTRFGYSDFQVSQRAGRAESRLSIAVDVINEGKLAGDEVVQLYVRDLASNRPHPLHQLCGFARVHLRAGERRNITFDVPAERFAYWNRDRNAFAVARGEYEFRVGGASDNLRLTAKVQIFGDDEA